jgi:hypothetical protein
VMAKRTKRPQCEGKQRFENRAEAGEALTRFLKKHPRSRHPFMSTYECPECGGAHFGHTPKDVYLRRVNGASGAGGEQC